MPLHDWTRVRAGLFHDFHNTWLIHLKEALNDGVLPPGYLALTDQRVGIHIPDVTATGPPNGDGGEAANGHPAARPHADQTVTLAARRRVVRRRVLVLDGNEVAAVVEIVSPTNKDGPQNVAEFAEKAADLLASRVHLAVVDVLPPGPADAGGMHPPIARRYAGRKRIGRRDTEAPPADRPLTFVGYQASTPPVAYLNYGAVGLPLPAVPLFLRGSRYVDLPLEQTYMTGYTRLPAAIRALLG